MSLYTYNEKYVIGNVPNKNSSVFAILLVFNACFLNFFT